MQLEGLTAHSIRVTWKVGHTLPTLQFAGDINKAILKSCFSPRQPPNPDLTNGVLRSYVINYREFDKQFGRWQRLSVSATREVESIVLSNLKPSTNYTVLVQAKTNAGVGPASTGLTCSTLDEREWAKHGWTITFITRVLKVCVFSRFKFTQCPLLLLHGYAELHIPAPWTRPPPGCLWRLLQCGETATWQPGWPQVRLLMLFLWLVRGKYEQI